MFTLQGKLVKRRGPCHLYRQEAIFERAGLAIARSTLAQRVGECGVQLQPLVDALVAEMIKQPVLHAGETPATMLKPAHLKDGKTQDTVYLREHSGLEAVCTARHVGDYHIKALALDVGIRRPLGVGAGGLAILGAMDPAEAESVVRINGPRYEAFGGLTAERLLAAVAETRSRGWSFLDSVATPGSAALGVALPGEPVVAAISVAAISARMPDSRHADLAASIARQAAQVAALMQGLNRIEPA